MLHVVELEPTHDAVRVQKLRCLLQTPAIVVLIRRSYESLSRPMRHVIKASIHEYVRSWLDEKSTTTSKSEAAAHLRHLVQQLAMGQHVHHSDPTIREWAVLSRSLHDDPALLDIVCELTSSLPPQVLATINVWLHATVVECNQKKAFVRPFTATLNPPR
jgi:hypothetical protein